MSRTRNQRRRTKEALAYTLAVLTWAVFIVVLLFGCAKQEPEPEAAPPVVEAEAPIKIAPGPPPASYQQVKPAQKEPEEDAGPDLSKLPKIENATLTHYCICEKCCGKTPDHPAYGITASGREAEPHTSVAVDPLLIPLGSTVYIDYGDGTVHEYRADDTGSGVAGAHIDLCVEGHQEALELGVKTVAVWYAAPKE